ncbi:9527_t:CDS:2 [Rhizophagus irregularis]|nr:9527_t:CDS:2 [Rhizophagus irregularis]
MACETELPDLPETEQFKKPGRKKNDVWNYFIKEEARKFDHSPIFLILTNFIWLRCKQSNHYLQKLALYILSIVPHSASCEHSDVFINEIENDNDPFENLVSDDEEENKQKMIQI